MTTAAPAAPPPVKKPPPPPPGGIPTKIETPKRQFAVSRGVIRGPERIGVYGPGGAGKSSLVASLTTIGKAPLIIDLDEGSGKLDVARIGGIETLDELRQILHDDSLLKPFDTVCIDSATKAEELCAKWVIANVPNDKGKMVTRLVEYGFGKEQDHVYETFLRILSDLDQHYRAGRNVVLIMHECTATVPNPMGEDFIRYEPRLQSPKSGKASIRHRVKEWLDHLLFIGYDVAANADGKAVGSGTRTIYPIEQATHWAKSRTLAEPVFYAKGGTEVWQQIFNAKD